MPKIIPFRGVRYNPAKIRDIATVVAPPYDVIGPAAQSHFYSRHPCNVVRLILGRSSKADTSKSNRYTRARDFFNKWARDGLLVRDPNPAIYLYSQQYVHNKKKIERSGFIALMDLGQHGKVLPHENTLAAPKRDRLMLMKATEANLEPIFVLYEDPAHRVMRLFIRHKANSKPIMDFRFESVRNRLWRMEDPALIKLVGDLMGSKSAFIADGHHRFETARNYHAQVLKKGASGPLRNSSAYIMVYFVESDDKALTILPAHRAVIDIKGLKKERIIGRLRKFFSIRKVSGAGAMMSALAQGASGHVFGLYLGRGDMRILKLEDVSVSDREIKGKPKDWKRLDVSILHNFIIGHVLKLSDSDDNIDFIKNPKDAIDRVDGGKAGIAFFLNPTKASEVRRIARIGERMPRKATYFYPKPLSGLVMYKFDR